MPNNQIRLSDEQLSVFRAIEESSDHFFITGKAGTGKSVLLRYFVEHTAKTVAVTAPTGLAAVNVGGQTLHSFFALEPAAQDISDYDVVYNGLPEENIRAIAALDTLVIDEISMVRADIMDVIDRKMRAARKNDSPFGGCQVVAFGDLFQLPPVVREEEVAEFLTKRYGTVFFFGAPACKDDRFRFVELTKVFRQSDSRFVDVLNHIRTGEATWKDLQVLNARRVSPPPQHKIITLTSRNDAAQQINDEKISELKAESFRYTGEVTGSFEYEDMPAPFVLTLREGAQIMMLKNHSAGLWHNGTLGKIASLSETLIRVEIDGHIYPVNREVWIKYQYTYDSQEQTLSKKRVGFFRQYPIRPAYAITIHKSQGQTFDAAIIDYSEGSAFAPGQTYVALSRCRRLDSLYLTAPLTPDDIQVDQEILDYIRSRTSRPKRLSEIIRKGMQVLCGQQFTDSAAVLPESTRAKIQPVIRQLLDNPELPDLHVEKTDGNGMLSACVDDRCSIVFSVPEDAGLLSLLYAGPHAEARRFADRYKVEMNPLTGGLQQVEKAPRRMTRRPGSAGMLSRIYPLEDAQMVSMDIPEAYREQLKTEVFTAGQLTAFKGLLPQEAYDTLEFILDGTPVDEAMEIWRAMTSAVIPAPAREKKPMFADYTPGDLISVGIPVDNVDKIRRIKTEKELEIIGASLPILARQSLYALKAGDTIEDIRKTTFASVKQNRDPDLSAAVRSPITLAEFAPIHSEEALRAILEFPREKWRIFLHPAQLEIIRQDYNGPARIIGGAGTGKTVVIVHRARRLASECTGNEKILVTTFGNTLRHDIEERMRAVCSEQEYRHTVILTVDKLTSDLSRKYLKKGIAYASGDGIKLTDIWEAAMKELGMTGALDAAFCADEWRDVIQAQNISSFEDYVSAQRSGRGRQFDRAGREKFWKLAEKYKALCDRKNITDPDWAQNRLAAIIRRTPENRYKSILVDECQDLRAPALRMLRALAGNQRKNDMYLSGDSRQRIYGGRVSLSQCGIAVNNRSRVLKLNYRTTDEIYSFAMQLQRDYQYDDMDGAAVSKDQSTCIFHGPAPFIRQFDSAEAEEREMIRDIRGLISHAVPPSDICIMVRSNNLLYGIRKRLEMNGLQVLTVTRQQPDEKNRPGVRIMTMHRGKGMEFSYVYLPCLREDVIPGKHDLDKARENETLGELMLSEANLLSVAITRAKYQVWLSYTCRPSALIRRYIVSSHDVC